MLKAGLQPAQVASLACPDAQSGFATRASGVASLPRCLPKAGLQPAPVASHGCKLSLSQELHLELACPMLKAGLQPE